MRLSILILSNYNSTLSYQCLYLKPTPLSVITITSKSLSSIIPVLKYCCEGILLWRGLISWSALSEMFPFYKFAYQQDKFLLSWDNPTIRIRNKKKWIFLTDAGECKDSWRWKSSCCDYVKDISEKRIIYLLFGWIARVENKGTSPMAG